MKYRQLSRAGVVVKQKEKEVIVMGWINVGEQVGSVHDASWVPLPVVVGTYWVPGESEIQLGYSMWVSPGVDVVVPSRDVAGFMQRVHEFVAERGISGVSARYRCQAAVSTDQEVMRISRFLDAVRRCAVDDGSDLLVVANPRDVDDLAGMAQLKTGIVDLCWEFINAHRVPGQ